MHMTNNAGRSVSCAAPSIPIPRRFMSLIQMEHNENFRKSYINFVASHCNRYLWMLWEGTEETEEMVKTTLEY